jgi:hypothetical protein
MIPGPNGVQVWLATGHTGPSPAPTKAAGARHHLHAHRDRKLNDIDPPAWLADVLARLPNHPAKRTAELLPWNWRAQIIAAKAAWRASGSAKPRGLHWTRTTRPVPTAFK